MRMRHKSWSVQEIKELNILYFMGVNDKEISTLLHRTPKSVNKKITRLKLRPKNTSTHIIKPGCYIPQNASRKEILQSMKEVFCQMDSEDFYHTISKKYPFKKIPKKPQALIREEKVSQQETKGQWRTTTELMVFLHSHNYAVKAMKEEHHHDRSGYTHILQGKAVRPTDLLIQANKIQYELGEPPFYLENITEE